MIEEQALEERLKESTPTIKGGLDYLNTSDVDCLKPVSQESYYPLAIFLGSTLLLNILAKCLMSYCDITPFEIIYVRGVISVILSMIYLKKYDIYLFSVPTEKSSLVLAGSLAGFIAVAGFYLALYHLNIVDAFAIDSLTMITALLIDYTLFHTTLRFFQIIGVVSSLIGLFILFRPFYLLGSTEDPNRTLFGVGIIAGIIGVICSGLYGGLLRHMFSTVHILVLLTFMQFAMALFAPCLVLVHFEIRNKPTVYSFGSLLGLLIVGALGWVVHWSLAQTLKKERMVSRVFQFKYPLVFVAIIADLIAFHMGITLSSILGIIFMGVNWVIGLYYLYFAVN
jgi:drug/metabolite transporter (DMT)-like permease